MSETMTLAPITKTVDVGIEQEAAFRLFTSEIATWWPTDPFSRNPGQVEDLVWEEREGGEVYEVTIAGERCRWATVLTWEPPHRLVIAWQVNPDRMGTEVEVRFVPDGGGTRVELEHRGWERVADGVEGRGNYHSGWDRVLARFVAGASS